MNMGEDADVAESEEIPKWVKMLNQISSSKQSHSKDQMLKEYLRSETNDIVGGLENPKWVKLLLSRTCSNK